MESQLTSTTAKAQSYSAGLVAKAKGLVLKGLLGRDAAAALVFFGVVATLAGAAMGLAKVMDPALAAATLGLTVIALLTSAALLIGRPPK